MYRFHKVTSIYLCTGTSYRFGVFTHTPGGSSTIDIADHRPEGNKIGISRHNHVFMQNLNFVGFSSHACSTSTRYVGVRTYCIWLGASGRLD